MKHVYAQHIGLSLLSVCLLSLALSVHAQEATTQTAPQDERGRDARQELRTERKSEVTRVSNERILNLSRNVTNRLTSALTRMSKISERIETRITKLKSLGVDTTEGEARLAEAKDLIATTGTALSTATGGEMTLTGDDPREAFHALRAQFTSIRDSIKQIHGLLRETVSLLKEAVTNAELGRSVSDAVNQSTENEKPTAE